MFSVIFFNVGNGQPLSESKEKVINSLKILLIIRILINARYTSHVA